jgi:hypothetical protein
VFELCDVARHTEAVRKADRDIALPEILGRKNHSRPQPKCARSRPDIDGDVVDFAWHHANELRLRTPNLKVEAANSPCDGPRVVVLDEFVEDASCAEDVGAVTLDEEPPRVAVDLRLDNQNFAQFCGRNAHVTPIG